MGRKGSRRGRRAHTVVAVLAYRRPPDVESLHLDPILEHEPFLGLQDDRRHLGARNRLPAWKVAEIFVDPRFRLLRIEVADDREGRVVRRVVDPEEALDVLFVAADRRVADDGPRIRMLGRVRGLVRSRRRGHRAGCRRPDGARSGRYPAARPISQIEAVEQEPHPVGLDPERRFEIIRRHGLVVVRAIVLRRPLFVPPTPSVNRRACRTARVPTR